MSDDWKTRWKERVRVGLGCGGCLLIPVVPFYKAFVVQNLWNWFLSDALHAATISYWQAAGIVIAIGVMTYKLPDSRYQREKSIERAFIILQALLPEEKLTALAETFKKEDESWTAVFATMNPLIGELIGNTIALIIGFVVHDFLM